MMLIKLSVVSQSITFTVKSIMPHKRQTIGLARKQKTSRTSEIDKQREARLEIVRVRAARSNYDYRLNSSVIIEKMMNYACIAVS